MRKLIFSIALIGSLLIIPILLSLDYSNSTFYGTNNDFMSKLNEYRVENSLDTIVESEELEKVAKAKCKDMIDRKYFDHKTPEGFYVWETFNYSHAGENLAKGFTDVNATFQGWVDSPTHNANLLKPKFTQVGHYTCFDGNQYLTVQIFKGE